MYINWEDNFEINKGDMKKGIYIHTYIRGINNGKTNVGGGSPILTSFVCCCT